jgi:pyruvate kinase
MKIPVYSNRRTRIICTLGPATATPAILQQLIRAGMDIARLNFSHGTLEGHARSIENVRRLSQRLGRGVAVLIDLPGPKYRIGKLKNGQVLLKKGDLVQIVSEEIEGDASRLPVTLPDLDRNIKPGDTVILDDGAMQLRVREIHGTVIECRVVVGGLLREERGLVVPGRHISLPFISAKLRDDIRFAIKQQPDFLAVSFVSDAQDIADVRTILHKNGGNIPIVAKIERGEAVKNFNNILSASDGIMVARGDLGVELPLERVPLLQKEFIRKCNRAGKPVITATEMLETMVNAARPTRAETTDVANAIFDGTDAIMLSAETAIGKYPVASVRMMAKIARAAEKQLRYDEILAERLGWLERQTDELISYNACQTAQRLRAAAIVTFTRSGSTARRVSKYRPGVPILALTPDRNVYGRLLLYWGIRPYVIVEPGSVDEIFTLASKTAKELGMARPGDLIIIVAGIPIGVAGSTNLLKVEKIRA